MFKNKKEESNQTSKKRFEPLDTVENLQRYVFSTENNPYFGSSGHHSSSEIIICNNKMYFIYDSGKYGYTKAGNTIEYIIVENSKEWYYFNFGFKRTRINKRKVVNFINKNYYANAYSKIKTNEFMAGSIERGMLCSECSPSKYSVCRHPLNFNNDFFNILNNKVELSKYNKFVKIQKEIEKDNDKSFVNEDMINLYNGIKPSIEHDIKVFDEQIKSYIQNNLINKKLEILSS